jgi:hypothetical protein
MVQKGQDNPLENGLARGPVGARKMPLGGVGVNPGNPGRRAAIYHAKTFDEMCWPSLSFHSIPAAEKRLPPAPRAPACERREKGIMTRLDQARAKLSAAIDRLEAVATKSGGAATGTSKRIAELEAELAKLRRDHAALEATVDLVAVRLDAAIGRLKTTVAA